MEPVHSIQMASRMTGLSQNLIRAWEQRYGAVEPDRSATRRRMYTQAEIQRLSILKQLTDLGHSIGCIARLENHDLLELLASTRGASGAPRNVQGVGDVEAYIDEALAAIIALDSRRLDTSLNDA